MAAPRSRSYSITSVDLSSGRHLSNRKKKMAYYELSLADTKRHFDDVARANAYHSRHQEPNDGNEEPAEANENTKETPVPPTKADKDLEDVLRKLPRKFHKGVVATAAEAVAGVTVAALLALFAGDKLVIGDVVQTRQSFPLHWYINKSDLEYFGRVCPHIQFIPDKHQRAHPHLRCNIDRERAENAAYAYITKHVPAWNLTQNRSYIVSSLGVRVTQEGPLEGPDRLADIVDIGGNPSRHAANNRTRVHSCCPILSAADSVRSFNHASAPRHCKHEVEKCTCIATPTAYLSVDSLYYLTPEEITRLVMKSSSGLLVAVIHEFDNAYGSFGGGEANYHLLDADTVAMHVRGNSAPYVHSNLSWMKNNAIQFNKSGYFSNKQHTVTLCWSKIEQFPEHSVYAFRVEAGLVKAERPIESVLSVALQDPTYYGRVNMGGAFNEKADKSLVGEIFDVPKVDVYSWGPFFVVYQKSDRQSMLAPKGLVHECAAFMQGRKRDATNWAALQSHARHHCRSYNVPPSMLPTAVFAACCLAFVQHVSFETATATALIEPMMEINKAHSSAMDLQFKWVWTFRAFVTAAMVFVTLFGLFGGVMHLTTPVVGLSLIVVTAFFLVLGIVLVTLVWKCRKKAFDPFERYRADRSSNQPRTVVLPCPKAPLPATPPPRSITELLSIPLDTTAKLRVGDVTIVHSTMPLHPAGIVSTSSIPIVPENSAHSAVSALVERALKEQPFHNEHVFDSAFFDRFQGYTIENFEDLFPGLQVEKVEPLPFHKWNARFPRSQQKRHVKTRQQYQAGNTLTDPIRQKPFVKTESLPKSDVASMEKSVLKVSPRLIQGATDMFNVVVAPFIQAFSKRLAKMWSVGSASGLMYTSGASATAIGGAYKVATERCAIPAYLEGDFARFDTTIHRRLLALEHLIYQMAGAPLAVLNALAASIKTHGVDKFGNKYVVDGTRHSGDPNTSCGNTMLQGLAIIYCIADYHFSITGVWLGPKELCETYNLAILLLGDDNLGVSEENLWTKMDLVGRLAKLGLNLEPKTHIGPKAKYEASFCSSRFYPVANKKGEAVVILGPPIGRVASKGGWYVNPPANMDMDRMVAGDARGRLMDVYGIPFLNTMWKRCITLTNKIRPADVFLTADQKRAIINNFHVEDVFYPSDETYVMIEQVYGLTRENEKEYNSLISSVKTLPCIVDYAPIFAAAAKDGVRADTNGDTVPPPEDLAKMPGSSLTKMTPWAADEVKQAPSDKKTTCKTCMRPTCQGNVYTRTPDQPLNECNDPCAFRGVVLTPMGADETVQTVSEVSPDVVIHIQDWIDPLTGIDPALFTSTPQSM